MSLLPIEQKMWQEKATEKTKNGKSKTDIVEKYNSGEKRIGNCKHRAAKG